MRPISITRALVAAVANAISLAQQTAGAGDLLINGGSASGGVATLDAQRKVAIASAGNLSAITFTVYGTDDFGRVISQAIAGPNNNSVSTTLDFKTVTQVSVSAAVGTDVTVGTSGVGASMPIPLDQYISPFNVTIAGHIVSGAVNFTLQYTLDDIFDGTNGPYTWFDDTTMAAVAVDTVTSYISPVRACRVVTNSGTGSLNVKIAQAGNGL